MSHRILLTTPIFPPDIGGPATFVPKVAKELATRGWKVTVLTLSTAKGHDDSVYPYKLIRIPRDINRYARRIWTIFTLFKLSKEADIVFANGIAMESALAARLTGTPLLQKFVGDVVWERAHGTGEIPENESLDDFMASRHTPKLELKKWLRNWWVAQGEFVIVPSHYLRRLLEQRCHVKPSRLKVIYNGFEMPTGGIKPTLPKGSAFRIVTSARLVPHKGVEAILRAAAMLNNAECIVIGDGPLLEPLKKAAGELGISCHFTGQISRKAALGYVMSSDVFVLNSLYEGLPHVAIEASALGIPIVATDVGGTSEVVTHGKNGLLIPPNSLPDLTKALLSLQESRELRTALGKGGVSIGEQLTDSRMLENTINSIETLINGLS
jgi:glycosyltransferase involved in cell wall biosynthesis